MFPHSYFSHVSQKKKTISSLLFFSALNCIRGINCETYLQLPKHRACCTVWFFSSFRNEFQSHTCRISCTLSANWCNVVWEVGIIRFRVRRQTMRGVAIARCYSKYATWIKLRVRIGYLLIVNHAVVSQTSENHWCDNITLIASRYWNVTKHN